MKNRVVLFSLLGAWLLLGASCTMFKAPTIKDVQSVKMTNFTGETLGFKAEAVFHNPNSTTIKIKRMEMTAEINGVLVGNIAQDEMAVLAKKSDSPYPFSLTFPTEKLFDNFLSALSYAATKKQLDVKYKGYVKVKYGIIPFRMPISYTGAIKLPGTR